MVRSKPGGSILSIDGGFQGSLFSNDFLRDSIMRMPDWDTVEPAALDALHEVLSGVFARFPTDQTPNESQTEGDLIWPVLDALVGTATLHQQNLAVRGRDDVPDGLLFADEETKAHANGFPEEWKRYKFGLALVESKRWGRPLDRGAPASRKPHHRPRCCATCAVSMTSQPGCYAGAS